MTSYCVVSILFVFCWAIFRRRQSKQLISNIVSRSVFITGCDSGFGRLLAIRLDKLGVNVYAGCLFEKSKESLQRECSSKLTSVLIDVTNTESVKNASRIVKHAVGESGLWGLVNNAGVSGEIGPIEFMSKKSFQKALDVNLLGAIDVTLAFLPLLKKSGEGRIVNMSSAAGRLSLASGGYTLSKFGMEAFSDGLSYDLESYGITVHVLNPAYYMTRLASPEYVRKICQDLWDGGSAEVQQIYGDDFVEKLFVYIMKTVETGSSNLNEVVDAYIHALFSKSPRNRYIVGLAANFLFIPISYLSLPWQKRVIKLVLWITGNPMVRPIKTNSHTK